MTAVRGVIHLTSNDGAGSARARPDLWEPPESAATRPFWSELDRALGAFHDAPEWHRIPKVSLSPSPWDPAVLWTVARARARKLGSADDSSLDPIGEVPDIATIPEFRGQDQELTAGKFQVDGLGGVAVGQRR